MTERSPEPRPDAPLVVFDFDHTLYDGDAGQRLITWLLRRNPLRALAALALSPLLGPMLAFLPTRRHAIGAYLWVGTFGLHDYRDLNALIDRYVEDQAARLRAALLPVAFAVFDRHVAAGDRVVIATGAPPELVHAILALAERAPLPVVGSHEAPRLGGLVTVDHCHAENKLRCLERKGYRVADIAVAYSDSTADLPLLRAARAPVVVNPTASGMRLFARELPPGTPMLNWGCRHRLGTPVAAVAQEAA